MTTAPTATWQINADVIGACNCDYGCPCTFDAPPSHGGCDGIYFIHINQGQFNGTALNGLTFGLGGRFPGAIHEGNGIGIDIIDERASPEQHAAIAALLKGEAGGPPAVFASLETSRIGPLSVPVEWELKDGEYGGRCRLGDVAEVELEPIKNPVTGVESPFTVMLGNGLLTDRMEMGTTSRYRVTHPELSWDHTGQFSTVFKVNWSGG